MNFCRTSSIVFSFVCISLLTNAIAFTPSSTPAYSTFPLSRAARSGIKEEQQRGPRHLQYSDDGEDLLSLFWLSSAVKPITTDNDHMNNNSSNNNNNQSSLTLPPSTPALATKSSTMLIGTNAAALIWVASAFSPSTYSLDSISLPSPTILSEILTDLSHVALDLITLWGPSAVVVRAAAVLGRILCMLADYLPDHNVFPEEAVFQSGMLAVAFVGLAQALLPSVSSQLWAPKPTLRDGKAFTMWAKPAGMTWEQYKALTIGTLAWKELAPDESIDTNTSRTATVYWLYKGQARVQRGRNGAAATTTTHIIRREASEGRLRQVDGAQHVDMASLQATAYSTKTSCATNRAVVTTRITAGPEGATLLTCSLDQLEMLLRHETHLREVWKVLLWQGLQDQLADAYQTTSSSSPFAP